LRKESEKPCGSGKPSWKFFGWKRKLQEKTPMRQGNTCEDGRDIAGKIKQMESPRYGIMGTVLRYAAGVFFTLTAMNAVAIPFNKSDIVATAEVVYAEALNQSPEGQAAIVSVIRERLRCKGFPKTIPKIIHQHAAFSCTLAGGSRLYRQSKKHKGKQWKAVLACVKEAFGKPVPKALLGCVMYKEHSVKTFPRMLSPPVFVLSIGSHDFYSLAPL
jgi:hypothetical protein